MDNYRKALVEYLEKNVKKGYTIESLRWALINQGYPRTSVERAINEFNKEMAKKAPPLEPPKQEQKSEIYVERENNTIKKPWWKKLFRL
ncbi:MAG: hypothetical protein QXU40_02365 [Candidatus Pacearchaeota archaeon]